MSDKNEQPSKPECKNCKYWSNEYMFNNLGVCRRHAPQVVCDNYLQRAESVWPTSTEYDWCGDHEKLKQ